MKKQGQTAPEARTGSKQHERAKQQETTKQQETWEHFAAPKQQETRKEQETSGSQQKTTGHFSAPKPQETREEQEASGPQQKTTGHFAAPKQQETREEQETSGQQQKTAEHFSARKRQKTARGQEEPKYQEADINSKRIFGNHTLCAQFLRDYSGLPMLANVQPEDIEDVSERYHLFREVELQADTVKKVHIREQEGGEARDIYILSLIDHKSYVDYDVPMQILKYMVCIWENEAKEQEEEWKREAQEEAEPSGARTQQEAQEEAEPSGARTQQQDDAGVPDETEGRAEGRESAAATERGMRVRLHSRKDFRYPPIYPIVYYEGAGEWTAARNLKERILCSDLFDAYIPDFTYRLVRTQDYSNEELLSKEDAISLLILLNKIQRAKDFDELKEMRRERINDVMQRVPVDVAEIILSAVRSLCSRLNLTEEETGDYIREVRGGNMGYLWENMEKMDIQLERRNTAEQRQRAEEAEQRADKAEQKLGEAMRIGRNAYRLLLSSYRRQGMSREAARKQLISEGGLAAREADDLLGAFWELP